MPELLELVEAADYLNITSLYEYTCQAIAELIKRKRQDEVRQILQQTGDLTAEDIDGKIASSPWLESHYEARDVIAQQWDEPTCLEARALTANDVFGDGRLINRAEFQNSVDIPVRLSVQFLVLNVTLCAPNGPTRTDALGSYPYPARSARQGLLEAS